MLPSLQDIRRDVARALAEDLGPAWESAEGSEKGSERESGDVSAALIPASHRSQARVICREEAVLCGRAWFEQTFLRLDPAVDIEWQARDGDLLAPGQTVCRLAGNTRALLSGERTALNFLQTLSGTATRARRYAERVRDLPVEVLDTRKTLPGLRLAQKYTVRCGGCHNHRLGLYDAFLIKENHILACGSLAAAVERARHARPDLPLAVEVEDLEELKEALAAGADHVLLDNFDLEALRQAVVLAAGRCLLEASGGITLDNIREVALTGVDAISVGALTKDLRAVDFSMRFCD